MHRYYIVEGETEKAFLEFLKETHYITPGKIRIFNLMQQTLSDGQDFLSVRNPELIGIIDTDVIHTGVHEHLLSNIKRMQRSGRVKILMQNKNFEDELSRLLQCKRSHLYERVKCLNSTKLLKRKLSNMTPKDYTRLLSSTVSQSPLLYCSQPNADIQDLLKQNHLEQVIIQFKQIMRLK